MQITAKTKYLNEPAVLTFGFYGDGSRAIVLRSPEGAPLAKATVCIVEYGYTPAEGFVVVKDYSENEGMLACLIAEGVIHAPESAVLGPYGEFPVCKLTEAALRAAGEA